MRFHRAKSRGILPKAVQRGKNILTAWRNVWKARRLPVKLHAKTAKTRLGCCLHFPKNCSKNPSYHLSLLFIMPNRNHGMSNKHHLTQTFLKILQARWILNLQSLHILFRVFPWSGGVLFFRDQALLLQGFQSHALRSGQLNLRPQIGWEPSMALPRAWHFQCGRQFRKHGNVTDWVPLGDADDIMLPCVAAWRCQSTQRVGSSRTQLIRRGPWCLPTWCQDRLGKLQLCQVILAPGCCKWHSSRRSMQTKLIFSTCSCFARI